ncbi:hypothetical protein B0H11DRAFT_1727456 [Mycena galericulata]|nr:hypothetical protein B0H11DRAFT_1755234 [Mycena galericulata]KAJ7475489.1 hypothetical protein B0H11DRAFT_1727456 [Mycena galericulata]
MDDSGSKAKLDLKIWRPLLKQGWYYLGPGASSGSPGRGYIVAAAEDGALADIVQWECIWTDAGSGLKRYYSMWRGVAPKGYVALGGIFVNGTNGYPQQPSSDLTHGIKAIRRDLVKNLAEVSNYSQWQVWNDHGTKARDDCSAWDVSSSGSGAAYITGAFTPQAGWQAPPRDVCFVFNSARVRIV